MRNTGHMIHVSLISRFPGLGHSESILKPIVAKTRKSCRKSMILTFFARYEAQIRFLVILYFFKVTGKVMYHI